MTIQLELNEEIEARLSALASARSMDINQYVLELLEQAASPEHEKPKSELFQSPTRRPIDRKSLAQLFAESPFKGLDLEFKRDPDSGRDYAL